MNDWINYMQSFSKNVWTGFDLTQNHNSILFVNNIESETEFNSLLHINLYEANTFPILKSHVHNELINDQV